MTPLNYVAQAVNPMLRAMPMVEVEYSTETDAPNELSILTGQQYFDFCHDELIKCPKSQDFLESKGISGEAMRELFIGFAARTFHQEIPAKDSFEGVRHRHIMRELKLLNALGRESAHGCFTYPLHAPSGYLNGAYLERQQCPKGAEAVRRIIWDKNVPAIFNYRALAYFDEVIVVSSPPEAARLWSLGYYNVIAIVNDNYEQEGLVKLFRQLRLTKIIINSGFRISDKDFQRQVKQACNILKTPWEKLIYGV